jgi:hypothetical protein
MSDYNDIAKRNPQGAVSVISSFGYEIIDRRNLGQSLNELIAHEGEPALRKVMEIHPDKDVILELFSNQTVKTEKQGCGCSSCNKRHEEKHEHYMNASGSGVEASNTSNTSTSNILAHQTNAILVVASLFIATVLILKNK